MRQVAINFDQVRYDEASHGGEVTLQTCRYLDNKAEREGIMTRPAWIQVIPETQAEGLLAELYERWMDRRHGAVDNILRVHSLHPRTLGEHAELYDTTMHGPSGLTLAEREMIGVVVSSINHCHY